jgi:hypothetical protein
VSQAFALLIAVDDVIQQPESWVHTIPATDGEDVFSIRFLIKSSESDVTVYKVDRWETVTSRTRFASETTWTFHLEKRRHCGDHLFGEVLSCANGPLTAKQLIFLDNLMSDGASRPEAGADPSLIQNAPVSLEDAKSLVARYYGVDRDQVSVTISS